MGKLLQGRDCGFTTQQRKSPITYVKTCAPLETIKGEPGLTTKTRPDTTHNHHTPSEPPRGVASSALFTTQSRDLGLSPLSQPACSPLLQASFGCKAIQTPDLTLDVGHP